MARDDARATAPSELAASAAPDAIPSDREHEPAWSEGDAAVHLEELLGEAAGTLEPRAGPEGLRIEIVGPHLRVAGTVQLGHHRRLSDFINNHQGLIDLQQATVLRRNGDPTRVYAPHIWINLDDVSLVGSLTDDRPAEPLPTMRLDKSSHPIIVVTQGHTLTGEVHLAPEAVLAVFIESNDPAFVPMTEVRTRSLADRRVVCRYAFALLNRRHIVAATALQPGMVRGRGVL